MSGRHEGVIDGAVAFAGTEPQGRRVIVSGAAGGVGQAIVEHLLQHRCSVAALDRDFSLWAPPHDDRLSLHEVELTDTQSLDDTTTKAISALGGCDSVVANAAIVDTLHRAETFPDDSWDRDVAVNLTASFRLVQRAFAALKDSGDGRVVFVSSAAAALGQPAQAAYAASKAGLIGLARTLAVEWGSSGICCNVVLPGMITTPKVESLPTDLIAALSSRTALGRFATPAQVAGTIAFLLSPAAAAISGAKLRVDGGFCLNDIALSGSRTAE